MQDLLSQYREAARQEADAARLTSILAQFFDFHPLPAWMKVASLDGRLRMFRVNNAYRQATGVNYNPGDTDEDYWSSETASTFDENDRKVIATRAPVEVKEEGPDAQGNRVLWVGSKWPIFNPVGEVIAVAGFAIAEPVQLTQPASREAAKRKSVITSKGKRAAEKAA